MWSQVPLLVVGLAVLFVVAMLFGRLSWESRTRELHRRLEGTRKPVQPKVFDVREMEGLPAPVQRYFRTVLHKGQPMVAAVTVQHTGTFNIGEAADSWKAFVSDQWVVTQRPGFLWDGCGYDARYLRACS